MASSRLCVAPAALAPGGAASLTGGGATGVADGDTAVPGLTCAVGLEAVGHFADPDAARRARRASSGAAARGARPRALGVKTTVVRPPRGRTARAGAFARAELDGVGGGVVGDQRRVGLVGDDRALEHAQVRGADEAHAVGGAVVLDARGVAFAVLVLAVALLAERGRMFGRAEGEAQALAVRVLAHLDAVGVDLQRALRDDHVADEDGAVLLQVDDVRVAAGAGDAHRLGAVGALGLGGQAGQCPATAKAATNPATPGRQGRQARGRFKREGSCKRTHKDRHGNCRPF